MTEILKAETKTARYVPQDQLDAEAGVFRSNPRRLVSQQELDVKSVSDDDFPLPERQCDADAGEACEYCQ